MMQKATTHKASTDSTNQLSKDQARKRLVNAIDQGFNENYPVLIEALPSLGKSYNTVKWAAKTKNRLTVFTARHELFDQYAEWCEENGLRFKILPSLQEDCETANGEHGKDWGRRIGEKYDESGLHPGELHEQSEKLFGERLPCQQEGTCSYFTARDFDTDEYDVLIGHYTHAHVPDRVEGRYVAFDEFPDETFLSSFDAEAYRTAVRSYLERHDSLPFDFVKDLKEYRHDPERRQEGIEWFKHRNISRDVVGVVQDKNDNAHVEAAAMTYAILVAKDLDNRWEYAHLPDGRTAVINPTNDSLTMLNPPTLDGAKSVIALDGTPTVEKWKLMLGSELRHSSVLNDKEKQDYLRNVLGIRMLQTTQAANHYSGRSAISVTPDKDLALFEGIKRRENQKPTLLTSQSALQKYEEHGLSEIVEEVEHYGNIKGSNEFGNNRVGIVAGSRHYGDEYIQKWAALAGESASRVEGTKGMNQDFGEFGNQILHGMRENEVLQAAMRFGRDGEGATVYIHTAALPEWVEREKPVPEIHPWAEGMNEVLSAIKELDKDEWRTKHITEQVSVSGNQVRNHLKTLKRYRYVKCRDEGRGFTWSDQALGEIGKRGHVEF